MQTSMKRCILYEPFQCKPGMEFFQVIFLIQMAYLEYFMSEIK